MKRNLIITSALLASLGAMAQTEVTVGVMRGKDYGVTYMLPKTEIEIALEITRHGMATLPAPSANTQTDTYRRRTFPPGWKNIGRWTTSVCRPSACRTRSASTSLS